MVVYGRVQGVLFRAYTVRWAEELGLVGYVRNLPDGAVEVCAEGAKEHLEQLINCLKAGPPSARVENIVIRWPEYVGNYSRFDVRY